MTSADGIAGLILVGLGVVLLASALVGSLARSHSRVSREGGTIFLPERLMQRGYDGIESASNLVIRLGLTAGQLSWLSFAIGVCSGLLAGFGKFGFAAWALTFSGVCDGLDGAVARKTQTATRSGAVLDSSLDRYVEFFFCAGIIYSSRGNIGVQMLALGALFGGFMVTYSTAKAEAMHVTPPRGWMKRAERIVWFIASAALGGASGLIGLSGITVVAGGVAVVAVFANISAVLRLAALSREP